MLSFMGLSIVGGRVIVAESNVIYLLEKQQGWIRYDTIVGI